MPSKNTARDLWEGCGAKRKGQRAATAGEQCSPLRQIREIAIYFPASLNLLLVGACIAGPPTVRGRIFEFAGSARAGGAKPRPYGEIAKLRYIFTKALPFACRGLHCRPANGAEADFWGLPMRQGRAEPSPAPTMKLQNGDRIYTHSLAIYGRGGALLHPRGLAASQGLSGRAMIVPTMKLQKTARPGKIRNFSERPAGPEIAVPLGVSARNEAPTPKALS